MSDKVTRAHSEAFQGDLLDWYDNSKRDLLWRRTQDPYRVWISEVMLQQTRTSQAAPHYMRFLQMFPTVEALANADIDVVLRTWEGLGYYARARHLHAAACDIVTHLGGHLPHTYEGLRALSGIGPYTARAILSIAFGLPYAAVDTNVGRILSRVFALPRMLQKQLQALADVLLDPSRPGAFNQALMDLGSMVCTPKAPDCLHCPLSGVCGAFAMGTPEAFPVKKKKPAIPHYQIAVGLLFDEEGCILIQRRAMDAMLGGLWEFPGGKREPGETLEEACRREVQEEVGVDVDVGEIACCVRQAYSHFRITLHAFWCPRWVGTPCSHRGLPLRWVAPSELQSYAFPRANRRILDMLSD